MEVRSVSAVTKFVSTLGPAMSSQTELIFCGIRVILGGGGGGVIANTRTENKVTSQISGLKTGKIKKWVVVSYQIMGQNSRLAWL